MKIGSYLYNTLSFEAGILYGQPIIGMNQKMEPKDTRLDKDTTNKLIKAIQDLVQELRKEGRETTNEVVDK